MDSHEPLQVSPADQPVRSLKIEEDGDFFKGRIRPKIRLMGRWLERAGFKPGTRVAVRCLSSGVIELRSETCGMSEGNQASSHELDCPF
jgi:hypothetical protein